MARGQLLSGVERLKVRQWKMGDCYVWLHWMWTHGEKMDSDKKRIYHKVARHNRKIFPVVTPSNPGKRIFVCEACIKELSELVSFMNRIDYSPKEWWRVVYGGKKLEHKPDSHVDYLEKIVNDEYWNSLVKNGESLPYEGESKKSADIRVVSTTELPSSIRSLNP